MTSAEGHGSSRFGANNRYGTFGAGSVGYLLSEESFLKDNKIVGLLKLGASYGVTGNGEIGDFSSPRLVSVLPYADQSGIAPGCVTGGAFVTGLGNPNLSWETPKPDNRSCLFRL